MSGGEPMSGPHVIVARSPDELLAAIPHVLGFRPKESLVLLPVSRSGPPTTRVDLPRTVGACRELLDHLRVPFGPRAEPGTAVALVCFTAARAGADLASWHVAAGLQELGIDSPIRLWATDDWWMDLETGQAGSRTQGTADRMALEAVVAGAPQPAASRVALAASLVGDRESLAPLLPAAWAAAEQATRAAEREWALDRLDQFHTDGNRLDGPDAARMLVAVQSLACREAVWDDMGQDNAESHIALWTDLTRRAPDDVRAPAASLLAFSSWLRGQGARAWCALDQVPPERPYALAAIVASALQTGLHPAVWDESRSMRAATLAAADIDESFVPAHTARRPELPPSSDAGRGHGHPSR